MGGMGSGGHNKIDVRLKLKGRQWEFTIWLESVPKDWLSYINDWNMPTVISPVHDMDYYTRRDFASNPDILKRHIDRIRSDEDGVAVSAGWITVFEHESVNSCDGRTIEDESELADYITWCEKLYNHFREEGYDYFPSDDRLPLILKKPHRHVIIDWRNTSLNRLIDELGDRIRYLGLDPKRDVRPVASMDGFVPYLCHLYETEKVHYSIEHIIALNGFKVLDYIDKDNRENETYRIRAINLSRVLKTKSWGKVYDSAMKDEKTVNLAHWVWKHQREFDCYLRSLSFDDDGKLKSAKTSDNISSDNTNQ